ncbi:MAG: tail fiber domain-containing protein, partial [Candidatus Aenigmarchaeota archaeon]|nr:tail fiber domain-containing protein [Candidatus Aenigmarchaeota archaeon]
GIGTTGPGYTLTVSGTVWVTSGAWSGSDVRWKQNITQLSGSLDKVMQLKPVSFLWKNATNMRFPNGTQIGFIAQDVEKIIPEVVATDNNGYKGISYERITPVLTGAIQELNNKIEKQDEIIKMQQQEIEQLRQIVIVIVQDITM